LPEVIDYCGDADLAYNVWSILEAVQWRWTIVEVLEQPEALINDVLMIAAMSAKMRKAERDNANG
jgi:hypothetical protein